MPKKRSHLLRLVQFSADPVNIHDPLSRVIVSDNLGIEFAQVLGLLFCERVARNKRVDLLRERIVRLLIARRKRQF